jgi:UDP-arabinose 4-epimerase
LTGRAERGDNQEVMKRILITGGAGYIGSHTAKAVARKGWEPVVFDNFSAGHEWAVQWGPCVRADLADSEAIRSAIRQYRPDAVVHFAASAYVGESMVNPRKYFRNNVVNSLNLLDVMIEEGVDTIVLSSSCATYGIPAVVPISEDSPQQPSNPYGESKLFVEKALRAFGGAYSLHWAALRYFNAAGADPDGDLGEDHDPEPHLIPRVIAAALDPGIVVDVFGADYPTPDGTAVRDYVHVCDLADAHLLALDCLWGGAESFNVNLGNSAPCSVLEVIAAVECASGTRIATRAVARRPGDPPMLVADCARALDWLGWKPRFPELDAMVETAWRWHRKKRSAR